MIISNQMLWKCSAFTSIYKIKGNVLLFSSINGKLLKFTPKQFTVIQEIFNSVKDTGTSSQKELIELLSSQAFLVPADFDEIEAAHQKYLANIHNNKRLVLVLSPTMRCNFSCSYCFEKNAVKGSDMNNDTQEKLIRLVKNKLEEGGLLDIQWFGGEPYMAFQTIESLTKHFQEICNEKNAIYEAGIITNGSLLTLDNISRLEHLHITNMQITLDGTPETFSRHKRISLENAIEFYDRIYTQIPYLIKQLKHLCIRINIDRNNYKEAYYVVDELSKRGLIDNRIDLRLGLLEGKNGIVDCIPHSCLSSEEYLEFDLEFKEYIFKQGFNVYSYPMPQLYPCATVTENSYSIDPSGNIYHCVPETGQGQDVKATLDHMDEYQPNEYQGFDPWNITGCKTCSLLPICLGRCPRRQVYEKPYKCLTKYKFDERLLLYSNCQR